MEQTPTNQVTDVTPIEKINTPTNNIIDMPVNATSDEPVHELNELLYVKGRGVQPIISPRFQEILDSISVQVQKAESLLAVEITSNNIDQFDDDEIENIIKNLQEPLALVKEIEAARKEMKNYLNTQTNEQLATLDAHLEQAGLNKLKDISPKVTTLKNDVRANRINKRWGELESTFVSAINMYPRIAQYTPSLMDYTRFRMNNQKLISGAKTVKVTDKTRKFVNDYMHRLNSILEQMEQQDAALSFRSKQTLVQDIIEKAKTNEHTLEWANAQILVLKEAERQEAEREARLRKQQEDAQKAQEEAQRKAQEEYLRQQAEYEKQKALADEEARKQQTQAAQNQTLVQPQYQQPPVQQQPPAPQAPVTPQGYPTQHGSLMHGYAQPPVQPMYTPPPNPHNWIPQFMVGQNRNMNNPVDVAWFLKNLYMYAEAPRDPNNIFYVKTNGGNAHDLLAITRFVIA